MRFILALVATFLFASSCPAADPDLEATLYQFDQQRFYLKDKEKRLGRELTDLARHADAVKQQIQQLQQELETTQTRAQAVKHDLISIELQLR